MEFSVSNNSTKVWLKAVCLISAKVSIRVDYLFETNEPTDHTIIFPFLFEFFLFRAAMYLSPVIIP